MPRSISLEWVNEDRALRLFRERLARAEARKGHEAVTGQTLDNIWDWVEMEEVVESRKFPTIPLAKSFGKRNAGLDMYRQPRIVICEWLEGDEDEAQEVERLELDDNGNWFEVS